MPFVVDRIFHLSLGKTVIDTYPMSLIYETLEALDGVHWFSSRNSFSNFSSKLFFSSKISLHLPQAVATSANFQRGPNAILIHKLKS